MINTYEITHLNINEITNLNIKLVFCNLFDYENHTFARGRCREDVVIIVVSDIELATTVFFNSWSCALANGRQTGNVSNGLATSFENSQILWLG